MSISVNHLRNPMTLYVPLLPYILFAMAYGSTDRKYDLNGDGSVGFSDFIIFAHLFEG